ncbi:GGDEF domain-containing protein [Saccharibacillus sp. O23]|nr:GGDEF domain-containing protein [Saccharibacillus sp. O23]
MWFDLFLFVLLFVLFAYIFFAVRVTNLHKVYFVFHFFMMLWPLCQFATHIVQDPEIQFVYVSLSFAACLMLASGWLLFTLFLAGDAEKLEFRSIAPLFLPAAIVSIGIIANPFHLFTSPIRDGYVDRSYGPIFWLTMAVLACYFLASLIVLVRALRSPAASASLKNQIRLVLWGICVLVFFVGADVLFNVILADYLPIIPGLTSLGIFITALFFAFVITRYKVFDLVSIAHEDIINTIPHGILVLDEHDSVVEANRALRKFLDIREGSLFDIETFFASVRVTGDSKQFLEHYKRKDEDLFHIELFAERGNGLHFILQTSPIFDASRQPIGHILAFQDVSQERRLVQELNRQNDVLHERNRSLDRARMELSQANRKLEEMALTDSLTQCYNRRYLTQRLAKDMMLNVKPHTPFSFILFDIDFFKTVNDRYGHVVGDEVLYRTAEAVRQCIRQNDILARYGGEEFILYLPNTDRETARRLAEKVRSTVESNEIRLEQSAQAVSVTVSIGVLAIERFVRQPAFDDLDEYLLHVFAEADKSLYEAKNNGRNRIEVADVDQVSFWRNAELG